MRKTDTLTWETIKDQHTTCLCYSEKKGMYITDMYIVPNEELLFSPHGYKGFWSQEKTIQKGNLKIRIETNFGYGNSSYMRALVEKEGKPLLDFDKSQIYILNNCSVMTHDVMPYEWKELFNKIILASRNYNMELCTTSAISYVEEISNILDKKEIPIKGCLFSEKWTNWSNDFHILLHALDKSKDLIKGCNVAKIGDKYFLDKVLDLCCKLLRKIKEIKIDDFNRLREHRLSESLFAIHEFMESNDRGFDFFSFFVTNK